MRSIEIYCVYLRFFGRSNVQQHQQQQQIFIVLQNVKQNFARMAFEVKWSVRVYYEKEQKVNAFIALFDFFFIFSNLLDFTG